VQRGVDGNTANYDGAERHKSQNMIKHLHFPSLRGSQIVDASMMPSTMPASGPHAGEQQPSAARGSGASCAGR
jgi:hypothetical protein